MSDGLHEDVGLLTWSQWVKAQDACSRSFDLCVELRAIGAAKIRQEGGGRSTEPALPLHPGWVLAQDIEAMRSELQFWDDDAEAANTEDGAELLKRITSAVQSAYHRFPVGEERSHVVPLVPCQVAGCQGRIKYQPPIEFMGDIEYTCLRCGAVQDPERVIADQQDRVAAIKAARASDERRRARQRRDREDERAYMDTVG